MFTRVTNSQQGRKTRVRAKQLGGGGFMIGFQGEGRFKSNLDEGMSCYIFSSNNFRTGSFLIFFFIIDYLNIENERKTRKKKKEKGKNHSTYHENFMV